MKTIRYWEYSVNTVEVEVPDDVEVDSDEARTAVFERVAMCGWDDVDVTDSDMEEV